MAYAISDGGDVSRNCLIIIINVWPMCMLWFVWPVCLLIDLTRMFVVIDTTRMHISRFNTSLKFSISYILTISVYSLVFIWIQFDNFITNNCHHFFEGVSLRKTHNLFKLILYIRLSDKFQAFLKNDYFKTTIILQLNAIIS